MRYEKLISHFTRRSNSGYVAVALVAGIAAGAILSLLFAPESGEDTRKIIREKAKDLGNNAKDKFNDLKNKLTGDFEELEDAVASEVSHHTHAAIKQRKTPQEDDLLRDEHHSDQPLS